MDYYTEDDASRVVEGSERIIEYCGNKIPKDQL
jgi:HEPN domain-containing protein